MVKTSAVTDGSITLGVAAEFRQFIADQLLSKADVIRAMHERVQLCQEPQTEFEDSATEFGWEVASASAAVPSWTPSWSTQKPAATLKPRGRRFACVHAVVCAMKLADPGIR